MMRRWMPTFLAGLLMATGFSSCPLRGAQLPEHRFYWDIHEGWVIGAWESELEKQVKFSQHQLEEDGLRTFVSYWGDYLANPVGGREQGSSWIQLLVVGAEYHLDHLGGWSGASMVASMTDTAGSNLSQKIGNTFTVSQAYVMNTLALYDLYFKQRLFEDRVVLQVGRMAAGQFFATMPTMGLGVSGAVNGNPTSLFTNAPFHATASASWGAHLKVKPAAEFYVETGVFQASPRIGNPVYHGVDFSIRPGDGILMMAETGWTPTFGSPETEEKDQGAKGLPGLYSFGAYLSSYAQKSFSGGVEQNAYGFYAMVQQMVWRHAVQSQQNVTLWGGVTYSPQEEIALLPVMGYGGVVWQGLLPARPNDSALLNFYLGGFSGRYADSISGIRPTVETVLELSYIVQLTENLQFQPDLQWIIQPGGLSDVPNALVLGFQVALTF